MPVSSKHKSLRLMLPKYIIIRDCVAGEAAIKVRVDAYLPRPNATDVSAENQARYDAYLLRAVFYNVVNHTLGGMVGQIFARDPIIEIPNSLDVVITDADGFGVNLIQTAKAASTLVVGYGRAGLFIDYPVTNGVVSKADIDKGDIRPTIKLYEPWNVINWDTIKRGGREILSLVVLEEPYIKKDDGFEKQEGKQWRVLRLDSFGEYTMQIYKDTDQTQIAETILPQDSNGQRLREIPFTFIGSENNDPRIDEPPMYDLASLNLGHYRNSADYEESCYIVGQPTPYFTGLTEAWVTNILKGVIPLGARAAVPLPVGASAGLLQAAANSMPFEAMQHKERQMVALGAKLIEQQNVQRTAMEAGLEHSDETSILSASADNVSDAITFALKWCGVWTGIQTIADLQKTGNESDAENAQFQFDLNTEFDLLKLTPAERQQVIAEWQAGALTWGEMRSNLRRGGIATLDAVAAQTEIRANPPLVPTPIVAPVSPTSGTPTPGVSNNSNPKPAPKKKLAPTPVGA